MSRIVARFIHEGHDDKSALPTSWTHPSHDGKWEGAQVLPPHRAIWMHLDGEHSTDDWYRGGKSYTHLALIEVSGESGDSGPLTYSAITPDDVEAMHVIETSDSALGWALEEIGMELDEEHRFTDEMGFVDKRAVLAEYEDEFIEMLAERAETVEPTFIDYD